MRSTFRKAAVWGGAVVASALVVGAVAATPFGIRTP